MAAPASITYVTVHATYVDATGRPMAGRVTFTPEAARLVDDADDTFVSPATVMAQLDNAGQFSVALMVSDDPDVNPSGWTYRVREQLHSRGGAVPPLAPDLTYSIAITTAMAPGPVALTDIVETTPVVSPGQTYVRSINGQHGVVTLTLASLGAGNAATRDVGTTAGTVAAGDDSRLTSLGNAATRNVGTTAGTVAAGDDSRLRAVGTTAGTVAAGNDSRFLAVGTTAGTVAAGDDSRLTSLGNAATRNVGTTAGTVAAGDDSRFTSGGGGADTVHVAGLVGDGATGTPTDDGPVIQAVLDKIGTTGNTTKSYEVVAEVTGTRSIYINSTVQVESDHTTLRFGSPLVFGPNGRIRIMGELSELPPSNKPHTTVDAAEDSTTLTLNTAAMFAAGDYIVIRGARDVNGIASGDQKEYHSIASIAGNVLTLAEPLETTFLAYNDNPGAPVGTTHFSEVTKAVATRITVTPNRDDRTITVVDSSIFAAGDIIQVLDSAHTTKPDGTIEASNYKHREIAEVRAIVSSTVIRISHGLHHTYDTTQNARVAKVVPIRHSTIRDASVTWAAMSTVGNAFEIKYGVGSKLVNCQIRGDAARTKSWKSQAFRLTDSYQSAVIDCYAANPSLTTSGRGYGATLYGATHCRVEGSRFVSLRHSVLFFNGACGNIVYGCHSEDCCISDYDLHGAECVDNLITGSIAVGGDSVTDDNAQNKTACKAGNTTHSEGDSHNVFANMLVVNYRGAAFEVVPSSYGNVFKDSHVNNVWTGVKIVANSANTALQALNTSVSNVDFIDVTVALLNVNGTTGVSMVRGFTLDNCRFVRATTGLNPQNAQRVHLRRNTFYDPALPSTTYAINANTVTSFTAKANDISGCARGIKLAACPSARVTGNTMHDLTQGTAYEDAGGNTGALVARNDIYGFTPVVTNSGTGPSSGGIVDVTSAYAADTPGRHGATDWNYDPIMSGSAAGQATTTGTVYLMKMTPQAGGVISNIVVCVGTTAPAGALTTAQNYAAIFDSTGARVAITGDQTTAWATSGIKTMALAAPVTLTGGKDYYVAIVSNSAAGTAATFVRNNAGAVTTPNFGFAASSSYRFAVNGTGATAMPSSLTLASNSGSGAQPYWVALS